MKKTFDLAIIGVYSALLIGGQFALSAISGVEIVTLLFTAFCFYFGVWRGMALATVFSLLRMVVFGFFPNVLVLYLIYYNVFALVIGLIGKAMNRVINLKNVCIIVVSVLCLTALFTVIDNIITPLFYAYNSQMTKAYWTLSLTALIPQCVCAVVSVSLLFPPLVRIFEKIKL